ncbi:alpha/beta fold hydrolase [Pseudomonas sp. CrR25]|nr:alpha/beta fold hydrolase [Pseudomonas sp. CrR25]
MLDGEFNGTTAGDLEQLFSTVTSSPTADHLVVHFHGGLVPRSAAEKMAEGLLPVYREAGAYPVFFFWNSGALKVLANNLDEVIKEPVFWRLVRRLAQLLAGKLGESMATRGLTIETESIKDIPENPEDLLEWTRKHEPRPSEAITDLTPTQSNQIERELKQDAVLKAESAAIAAALREPAEIAQDLALPKRGGAAVRASRKSLMSPAVLKRIAEDSPEPGTRSVATLLAIAKYGVQIARAVIGRYRNGRDHGLLTTIVEEVARTLYADSIGSTVWTLMKGDTRDAFGPEPLRHGGTAFVQHLVAWWKPGRRITLIGHSTGALYIGYLLEQADRLLPAAAKFDVVFLAPACTYDFLNERLPLLTRRIAGFRLFGLKDELERNYWEVPLLYPSSLLYMVSGLFEDPVVDMPIVGMQRYLSASGPYDQPAVRSVTEWIGQRSLWSQVDEGQGLQSTAERHGGFSADPGTLQSLKHILQHGF